MSSTPDDANRLPGLLVGTDLVSVDRLSAMLSDQPGLAEEIFTSAELAYAARHRHSQDRLAARFAAKEAVFKALGTGLARGVSWREVEVVNGASGRPRLKLSGATADAANKARVWSMQISLSHTAGLAVAFVALLCDPRPEQPSLVDSRRECSSW